MNPKIEAIKSFHPNCTSTYIGISVILLFSSSQTPDQTLPVISTKKNRIIRIKFLIFSTFLSSLLNLIECNRYINAVACHLKYLLNERLSGQFVHGTGQRSEYNGYFVNMLSCPYSFNTVHRGTWVTWLFIIFIRRNTRDQTVLNCSVRTDLLKHYNKIQETISLIRAIKWEQR